MIDVATSTEHAEFCERVKARRKELGLTQVEVAQRLRTSQSAYADIEGGRREPGLNLMVRVARALDTTINHLLPSSSRAVAS